MQKYHVGKISITNEFRQMMLEFTVTYLIEQPADPVAFAYEYFQRLHSLKYEIEKYDSKSDRSVADDGEEEDEENFTKGRNRHKYRRKSIAAEPYNPEEDDNEPPEFYQKTDKEKEMLRNACANIFIFRSLEHEQLEAVIDATFAKFVKQGETIIKEGDDGDYFYVIEQGVYNAFKNVDNVDTKIYTYYNAGYFGELALLYNQPRAATIKAASDGKLWAMSRQTFRKIVLRRAFQKRKLYENLIASVPMLESLQLSERLNLADALITKLYEKDDWIIKQNDEADGMYFIESGEVRVVVLSDDGKELEIKRLSGGDYFGELALVTQKPRAASVQAVTKVKTAFLDVEAFERLLGPCMQIMQRNIATYEDQLIKIFGTKQQISDLR